MIFTFFLVRIRGLFVSLLYVLTFLLVFSACQTAPTNTIKDYPSLIAEKGDLLVSFNLTKDKKLVKAYVAENKSTENLSPLLDRTEFIYFSFKSYPSNIYTAVATGRYPVNLSNMLIGSNSSWIKHKDTYVWWTKRNDDMEISIPIRNLAVFSSESVEPVLLKLKTGKRGYIPESFQLKMGESAVSVYSRYPDPMFFTSFGINSSSVHVEEIELFLVNTSKSSITNPLYKMWGALHFTDAMNAKIFNTGLKLALLTMAVKEGNTSVKKLIKSKPFTLQENSIIFNGVPFTLTDIMGFIQANHNHGGNK